MKLWVMGYRALGHLIDFNNLHKPQFLYNKCTFYFRSKRICNSTRPHSTSNKFHVQSIHMHHTFRYLCARPSTTWSHSWCLRRTIHNDCALKLHSDNIDMTQMLTAVTSFVSSKRQQLLQIQNLISLRFARNNMMFSSLMLQNIFCSGINEWHETDPKKNSWSQLSNYLIRSFRTLS